MPSSRNSVTDGRGTIGIMNHSTSFVPGGCTGDPSPVTWAGWFTLCAVIAFILAEQLVDHPTARFVVFAALTFVFSCLSVYLRNLLKHTRAWLARIRAQHRRDQSIGPPGD